MSIRKLIHLVFSGPQRNSGPIEDPTLFHVPAQALEFNRLVVQASSAEAQEAQKRWEALVDKKRKELREQRRNVMTGPAPSPIPPSVR